MLRGWIWIVALAIVAASYLVARAEPAGVDPRRAADALVWRWAPVYVHDTSADDPSADRPTRIDFDGDWDATNNWDNLARYRDALPAAAYAAGILSETHAYLTYTLYYPRDWRDGLCVSLICHDNDLETVMMVVERDGAGGRLVEVRAKAHLRISDTAGADIARTHDGRPLLHVESEGHGITVCRRGDPACRPRADRTIYVPGEPTALVLEGAAVPPDDRVVRYELLRLRETLWARRDLDHAQLWSAGETGPLFYAGRSQGRLGRRMGASMAGSRYQGGVRPPWALKGALGNRGDWFLDPAAEHARTGSPVRYVHNPFLDDLAAECVGPRCARGPRREPTRVEYWVKIAAPYALLSLGGVLMSGRLRRLGAPARSSWRKLLP